MPMLDQHGQLLLSVEAANTGGVHCDPSGELELADSTGAVLARLPLALTESLLPATRQAALAGPLEVPTGRYRAHARLTCPDDAPAEASLQFSSEPRLELRRPDRLEASAEHLAVELLNRGEIAVEPLGSLFADDLQAGRVTRVDLEPRALLLPGASLVLEAEIPDGARSELAGLTALVLDGGGEPLVETIRPTAPLLGPAAPDDLLATRLGPATASGPTPFLLLPGLEIQLSGEQSTLLALALLAAGLCLLGLGLRAAERNAAERSRDPAESLTA
jgi:hypothetical protein